jgi:stearoyl-CoA desaturase (Delta-9 desaturase)
MSVEWEVARPGARPARPTMFSSPGFHRLQLRHFFLFDVLPFAGTVAAILLIPWLPPTPVDLALVAILWLLTGLALTVGFHRYFAHRSFSTARPVALALIILGSMAARGAMISWVAMHRRHHERSDHEGDLHSPHQHGNDFRGRLRGLVHAHLTWMMRHDYPNVMHYAPDLMDDRLLVRCNSRYFWWVACGLAVPAVLGGVLTLSPIGALTGFLWGGVVRICLVEHTMSAINSLCHTLGSRPFRTRRDNSRNIAWLALPTWGEAWHNNHHAFSSSAAFGLAWYQLDPGFWLIRMLEAVGLAWDVKMPSSKAIAQRRLALGAPALNAEPSRLPGAPISNAD